MLSIISFIGLSLAIAAVVLENFIGANLTIILGGPGTTLFILSYFRRNIELRLPKFVFAEKYLNIGMGFLALGTLILTVGAGQNIASSSSSAGVILELVGTVIFAAAAFGVVFALVTANPLGEEPI